MILHVDFLRENIVVYLYFVNFLYQVLSVALHVGHSKFPRLEGVVDLASIRFDTFLMLQLIRFLNISSLLHRV